MWLLLIEDEERLAESLRAGLQEEGFRVDLASDGIEGEEMAMANAYDLLIVDWRLPGQDGKTVIERLRHAKRATPVLMLTALGDVAHRVAGLEAGADDYLPKPFKFEELLARIRALLRRPPLSVSQDHLELGPLVLDARKRTAAYGETRLDLRPKEFALLEDLLRHPEEVISRTILAERVWGDAFHVSDNVIDVTISGLRTKLAEAADAASRGPVQIETVRGVGYRIVLSDGP